MLTWTLSNHWIGMGFVIATLTLMLQLLSMFKSRFNPHPEIVRKALHVVMGTVTLTFPWIFRETWPVAVLAIASATMLSSLGLLSKIVPWNSVLEVNGRRSYGQICFPLAVGIVFVFSKGDPLLYCIPVLVLTLADAMSALIGVRYGSHHYATVDGEKSTEGSLAFFIVAFLGTHIPLLLFFETGRLEALCLGLIMGILGTLFEGIAWRGFDNMLIPLGAFFVLQSHLGLPAGELIGRVSMLLLLLAFTVLWRKKTTLNGSAILGAALFSYFSFAVGGIAWMAMPLIVFAGYRCLMPRRFWALEGAHSIYGVISVASTGVLWLLWANHQNAPDLIYPYTIAFAAHASIITIAHVRARTLNAPRLLVLLAGIAKSWLLLFLPLTAIEGFSLQSLTMAAVAPMCIGVPTIAFYLTQRENEAPLTSGNRWLRQAGLAICGSLLGLIPVALIP
ncbi:MAG TPA: hypothetical protein V6D17_10970 [Candidatus Obscuribacterales bacterium]